MIICLNIILTQSNYFFALVILRDIDNAVAFHDGFHLGMNITDPSSTDLHLYAFYFFKPGVVILDLIFLNGLLQIKSAHLATETVSSLQKNERLSHLS